MRFSPYAMADYGLQHRGGSSVPLPLNPYSEGQWNLLWTAVPEYDDFLNLKYEDFDAYWEMLKSFPFQQAAQARLLLTAPALASAFASGTPEQVLTALQQYRSQALAVFYPWGDRQFDKMVARLKMAQSLVDMSEAAALCSNVLRVDFRAGRRL